MATCTISATFTDQAEQPVEGFRVSVYVPATPVSPVVQREATYMSDDAGLVEFDVPRGARIRVTFIQRGLSREFDVPDAATADLLTLLADAPDPFSVVAS